MCVFKDFIQKPKVFSLHDVWRTKPFHDWWENTIMYYLRSIDLKLGNPIEEKHEFIVELGLNIRHLLAICSHNLTVTKALFDPFECTQDIP